MLNSKRDSVTKVLDVGRECKRQSRKDGQETDRVEKNDGINAYRFGFCH